MKIHYSVHFLEQQKTQRRAFRGSSDTDQVSFDLGVMREIAVVQKRTRLRVGGLADNI